MLKFKLQVYLAILAIAACLVPSTSFACSNDNPQDLGRERRARLDPKLLDPDFLRQAAELPDIQDIEHFRSGGVKGDGSSMFVLDVAFSGIDHVNYDVHPAILARLNSHRGMIAHGATVSCAAAGKGKFSIYAPMAAGATVIPFISSPRRELTEDGERGMSTINKYVMDGIEATIERYKRQGKPIPRVINMSMAMVFSMATLDADVNRFAKILDDNDMLLVKALGNKGCEMDSNLDYAPYQGQRLDVGYVDITSALLKFRNLLKRVLLVSAAELLPKAWPEHGYDWRMASYSNRAGDLQDHVLCAEHALTLNSSVHTGTSHSAPKGTTVVQALSHLFPELSMVDIKRFMLSSALKPGSYDAKGARHWGQGLLHPTRAWLRCVKEIDLLQHNAVSAQIKAPGMPSVPDPVLAPISPTLLAALDDNRKAKLPKFFCADAYIELYPDILRDAPRFNLDPVSFALYQYVTWGIAEGKLHTERPIVVPADLDVQRYVHENPRFHEEAKRFRIGDPFAYARAQFSIWGRNEDNFYTKRK